MTLQPLILMMDIPRDMIQTDSPEGSSFNPTNPVTIQNQHQPLFWTVPTVPASADYYFYSTPIQKSRGTSYCSMNSKSFSVHSHHAKSLLLSVEIVFTPSKSRFSPWFQQSSAASDAPFSLFKGANSSVFKRLYFLASAFTTSRNNLPLQQRFS